VGGTKIFVPFYLIYMRVRVRVRVRVGVRQILEKMYMRVGDGGRANIRENVLQIIYP
jgi:hypothetical protein